MKKLIILFLGIFLLSTILADEQLITFCGGDDELMIPCYSGDLQNYPYQTERYLSSSEIAGAGGIKSQMLPPEDYSIICDYIGKYPNYTSYDLAKEINKDSEKFVSSADVEIVKENQKEFCIEKEEVTIMGNEIEKSTIGIFILVIIAIIIVVVVLNRKGHQDNTH